jgi:hypothetical protein
MDITILLAELRSWNYLKVIKGSISSIDSRLINMGWLTRTSIFKSFFHYWSRLFYTRCLTVCYFFLQENH